MLVFIGFLGFLFLRVEIRLGFFSIKVRGLGYSDKVFFGEERKKLVII